MTGTDTLTTQAAHRIAAHLSTLRRRYPGALQTLRTMAGSRGERGLPTWEEWCWLPIAGAAAIVTARGGHPVDYSRVTAVGQWRLTGRRLVVPGEEVAAMAVPGVLDRGQPLEEQIARMDLRLPRADLLEQLAGACYYLVTPIPRPEGDTGLWVHGCYVHLEHDVNEDRAELRLLVDVGTGWDELTPVPIHLAQPTLTWSMTSVQRVIERHMAQVPVGAEALAAYARTLAWFVWPLIGALLDQEAYLVGPRTLTGVDDPMVDGAEVWELTYTRPKGGHLRPV